MPVLTILRQFSPAWSTRLLYLFVTLGYIWRFIFGTILGIFLFALSIYAALWITSDSKPFTLPQLILWISELPAESKTAIATSVLTIAGFLVAFHIATLNWRQQAHAHLQVFVAGEIEQFFAEASRLILEVEIYARMLVEGVEKIQTDGATPEAEFKIQYALDMTPGFLATRQRLSNMSVEVHRILGKNYSLLSTVWGATRALEEAIFAFTELTQAMWFRVPYIDRNDPDVLVRFLAQVRIAECLTFLAAHKRNNDYINGITGGIRGLLLAPVVGFNFASLLGFLKNRGNFRQLLEELRRNRPGGG